MKENKSCAPPPLPLQHVHPFKGANKKPCPSLVDAAAAACATFSTTLNMGARSFWLDHRKWDWAVPVLGGCRPARTPQTGFPGFGRFIWIVFMICRLCFVLSNCFVKMSLMFLQQYPKSTEQQCNHVQDVYNKCKTSVQRVANKSPTSVQQVSNKCQASVHQVNNKCTTSA